MAWITPKTNWNSDYTEDGLYGGDFFNVSDYNRIKNNLAFLRDYVGSFVGTFPYFPNLGADKHRVDLEHPDLSNDIFYAEEINAIEEGLEILGNALPFLNIGYRHTYYPNGRFIDAAELNRIESAQLLIYNTVESSSEYKMHLPFRLGYDASTIKP